MLLKIIQTELPLVSRVLIGKEGLALDRNADFVPVSSFKLASIALKLFELFMEVDEVFGIL